MTITAKFRSVCPNCHEAIEAGETVIWEKGSKARHPKCQAAAPRPEPKRIPVEDQGVYVLEDGAICKVQANKDKSRTYAKRWVEISAERALESATAEGQTRAHGEWHYEQGLVRTVADQGRKMTLDEAKAFIVRYGQCVRCGRHLSAAKSVEQGIGPICIKFFASPVGSVA